MFKNHKLRQRRQVVKELLQLHDAAVQFFRAGYPGAEGTVFGSDAIAIVGASGGVYFTIVRRRWWRTQVFVGCLSAAADWLTS